jgi:ribosome recycling factor
VPLPPLSEERRKELGKIVRKEGEDAKIAVRNVRRDGINHLKDALKKKEITEDDEKRGLDVMQKLTDRFVADADKQVAAKEKDLLQI